jgi:MoaA/NifB/PqqE/SkfB family radical SAM enzyme
MIDSLGENYDLNKLDYVTAIHSSNPKIHDSITGVEGSFKETMKGLENLSEFYINTTIKHIMNKKSFKTKFRLCFINKILDISISLYYNNVHP